MYMSCHMTNRLLNLMYSIPMYYSIRFSSFDPFRILVSALNSAYDPENGSDSITILFTVYESPPPSLVYKSPLIQISAYTNLSLYESQLIRISAYMNLSLYESQLIRISAYMNLSLYESLLI